MKPKDDIHKLIKKMQIKASADLDKKVHNDISRAIAESKTAIVRPSMWRYVTKGGVRKLAVAAVIVVAFVTGFFAGRRSKPSQPIIYSIDVTGYTTATTSTKAEEGFWHQKALAAMQPRPYTQNRFDKTSILNAYKQYLKEKSYD